MTNEDTFDRTDAGCESAERPFVFLPCNSRRVEAIRSAYSHDRVGVHSDRPSTITSVINSAYISASLCPFAAANVSCGN